LILRAMLLQCIFHAEGNIPFSSMTPTYAQKLRRTKSDDSQKNCLTSVVRGALLSAACTLLLAIRFEPFMESDIALRSMPVER